MDLFSGATRGAPAAPADALRGFPLNVSMGAPRSGPTFASGVPGLAVSVAPMGNDWFGIDADQPLLRTFVATGNAEVVNRLKPGAFAFIHDTGTDSDARSVMHGTYPIVDWVFAQKHPESSYRFLGVVYRVVDVGPQSTVLSIAVSGRVRAYNLWNAASPRLSLFFDRNFNPNTGFSPFEYRPGHIRVGFTGNPLNDPMGQSMTTDQTAAILLRGDHLPSLELYL